MDICILSFKIKISTEVVINIIEEKSTRALLIKLNTMLQLVLQTQAHEIQCDPLFFF